ncbi:hypothetical protein V6N11_056313 [Hibiscus sabdariffa]|uniref:Uncharacterized protein n=1 Tax=Hibiscus sabdariffa TaxID=183260 RepID=A0ABR2T426_9ROSI
MFNPILSSYCMLFVLGSQHLSSDDPEKLTTWGYHLHEDTDPVYLEQAHGIISPVSHLPVLERHGSPFRAADMQTAKRGKVGVESSSVTAPGDLKATATVDTPVMSHAPMSYVGVLSGAGKEAASMIVLTIACDVRLSSIGYQSLSNRIRLLWQPQGSFQVVDLATE